MEIEQAAGAPGGEPGSAGDAGSMKFKDIGQLWKAYQCLEAEFTRKCQRLAELERRGRAQPGTPAAEQRKAPALRLGRAGGASGKQPAAGDFPAEAGTCGTEGGERAPEEGSKRDPVSFPALREAVIRDFLSSVSRAAPAEASVPGGRAVSSPPRRPESFAEAGELFLKHLNGK